MKGGFTYRGVDIAELGLEYAPEIEETYVYRPAASTLHDETFDGHNGGYYYGITYQPKEFTLRCFFEEERIDRGVMAKVYATFKKGSSGRLVFQRRPWCYYNVVIEDVLSDFKNYLNGLVTIKAKAYYPYARSDVQYAYRTNPHYPELMSNTAIVTSPDMLLSGEIDCSEDITTEKYVYLLNPGTEPAPLGIEIAGDAISGVYITNQTTEEQMKFIGLTKEMTSDEGCYIYTDSINGRVVLKGDGTDETKFLYHDYGFLSLEPAFPAIRDLFVRYANSNTVEVTNMLYDIEEQTADDAMDRYAGKHIFLNGAWQEIARVNDEHHLVLTRAISGSGFEQTMVVQLNKIYIRPVANDMALTRLNFIFKPTYA